MNKQQADIEWTMEGEKTIYINEESKTCAENAELCSIIIFTLFFLIVLSACEKRGAKKSFGKLKKQ